MRRSESPNSQDLDTRFAHVTTWVARQVGNPLTFGLGALLIVIWAALGPLLGFSDMWQLTVNTATTIIT
jgi:low affinity Fe/Cu permease